MDLRRLVMIAVVLLACVTVAQAATFYASPTGTDAGDGSKLLPWKIGYSNSPGKLDQLATGDTLLLLPGVYKGPVTLPVRTGATGYVTIAAETPRTVTIAAGTSGGSITTGTAGANYIRLRGIDFAGHYMAVTQAGPLTHFEMLDCRITGGTRGVKLDGPGADWTFRNVVHEKVPQGLILGVKGSTATIDGVLVESCQSIDCDHPDLTNTDGFVMEENVRSAVIRDCVSHGSEDTGFDIKASPLLMERCEAYASNGGFKIWGLGAVLRNCYAHDCGDYGATMANDGQRLEWCSFTRNGRCAIRAQGLDNQTHTYLGCVFDSPVGMPPLRNGYNDTYPKTSYCWWRAGSSPVDVLWGLNNLYVRYRDAAQYLSPTDVIGGTGEEPLDPSSGGVSPGSGLATMGPGGVAIGWKGTVPAGEIAVVPPNATVPPGGGTETPPGGDTGTVDPPPVPDTPGSVDAILAQLRALPGAQLMEVLRRLQSGE